jgi:hypothetical protein
MDKKKRPLAPLTTTTTTTKVKQKRSATVKPPAKLQTIEWVEWVDTSESMIDPETRAFIKMANLVYSTE